jgi:hypothetical protein
VLPVDSVVAVVDLAETVVVEREVLPRQPAWAPEVVVRGPGLGMEPVNQSRAVTVVVLEACQEWQAWEAEQLQGQPMEKFRLRSLD